MPKNKGKQTIQGKAFEYACLNAIVEKLSEENKEFRNQPLKITTV